MPYTPKCWRRHGRHGVCVCGCVRASVSIYFFASEFAHIIFWIFAGPMFFAMCVFAFINQSANIRLNYDFFRVVRHLDSHQFPTMEFFLQFYLDEYSRVIQTRKNHYANVINIIINECYCNSLQMSLFFFPFFSSLNLPNSSKMKLLFDRLLQKSYSDERLAVFLFRQCAISEGEEKKECRICVFNSSSQ